MDIVATIVEQKVMVSKPDNFLRNRKNLLTVIVKGLNKRDLFSLMPETFKRNDIIAKGKELQIAERSVDRILKKLLENNDVEKLDRFTYKKVVAAK